MAIMKCPDCGKMISDLAPACIGCGRPMTPVTGLSPAPPPSPAPSEEPRRTSVPTPLSQEEEYSGVPEGTARPPSDLPKKKIIAHKIILPPPEPKKRFTATKTFTMAFLLTGILSVVVGAFALSQGRHVSKNPIWTFAWMYLSVEAWRSWGWKALLPYPISVAATVLIGGLLFVSGVELMSWPYIIVIGVCNLGGLILFNLLLQKSKAAFSERDFRNRNKETSQDTRAPFWPVALVALIIGGIFYGVYVSNRPVHNPNDGRTNETSRQSQPAPPAASNVDQQQAPGGSAPGKVDWNKELTAAASAPTSVAPTANKAASPPIELTDEDVVPVMEPRQDRVPPPAKQDTDRYKTYVEEGNRVLALKDYHAAAEAFKMALILDSTDPDIWSIRGLALVNLGRSDEALLCADEAIARDSRHYLALAVRGWAYLEKDDIDRCLNAWGRFLDAAPPSHSLYSDIRQRVARLKSAGR